MIDGREALYFLTESAFRTAELVLASALLVVVGFAIWLVGTQPGSPDGGGVVIGLLLFIFLLSVLLASIVVIHAFVDFGRFVAN